MGSVAGDSVRLSYPPARRDGSLVDTYHGVQIPDPYRWLEDPDSEETKEFVATQAGLAESVLAGCSDREGLRREVTRLFDHPRHGAPFRRGDKYFHFHNSGLQAQSVLYVQDDLDKEAEVLLDPNTLSKDGTVALSTYSISKDGKYFAYGLSESGSDWITIRVMRIADRQPTSDKLSWVKFSSISWTHDGKGFFYGRYPAPGVELDAGTETNINLNHQIYYHVMGSDQSEDILCWKDPKNPKHSLGASLTEDGKYIILGTYDGCDPVNKLYYCEISSLPQGIEGFKDTKEMLPFVKLIDNFDAQYEVVANDGDEFTFLTNKNAPKNKLVRVNIKNPEVWTDVICEHERDVLESVDAVNGNQLVVCYMSDVKHTLQIRDLITGNLLHQLPLEIGSVSEISCKREDKEVFIGFTSFLSPGITYRCNLTSTIPEMKVFREISVPGFDRTGFEVKQIFVPSKDGTKIPMFIMSKKDIKLDGSHPTLLYGYGGFNISITPSFSVSRLVLCKNMGSVVCIANIRGGGEYGEEWHKAGALANKQNVFDDFIACAEQLISAGYTSNKKICIEGGSNGGLLVAACINQRPDLFGCALAHVGVMDMLRFHKFTIGHAWTTDYGCSDKEEEFGWLIKYSPLHNVKRPWEQSFGGNCQYPATMLLTADHDDRVVPLHSLKLLATMQYVLCTSIEDSPQTNPIIGRIDRKSGHGAGRPTKKLEMEIAELDLKAKVDNAIMEQEATQHKASTAASEATENALLDAESLINIKSKDLEHKKGEMKLLEDKVQRLEKVWSLVEEESLKNPSPAQREKVLEKQLHSLIEQLTAKQAQAERLITDIHVKEKDLERLNSIHRNLHGSSSEAGAARNRFSGGLLSGEEDSGSKGLRRPGQSGGVRTEGHKRLMILRSAFVLYILALHVVVFIKISVSN